MSTTIGDNFSVMLNRLRGARSKAEFARFLGVSPQVYQRYEHGRVPRADMLSAICSRCGVTVESMLGYPNEHPPQRPDVGKPPGRPVQGLEDRRENAAGVPGGANVLAEDGAEYVTHRAPGPTVANRAAIQTRMHEVAAALASLADTVRKLQADVEALLQTDAKGGR